MVKIRRDRVTADEAAAVRRALMETREDWDLLAKAGHALALPVPKRQTKAHQARVRRIVAAKMVQMDAGPDPVAPRLLPRLGASLAAAVILGGLLVLGAPAVAVAVTLVVLGATLQEVGRAGRARV